MGGGGELGAGSEGRFFGHFVIFNPLPYHLFPLPLTGGPPDDSEPDFEGALLSLPMPFDPRPELSAIEAGCQMFGEYFPLTPG